MKTVSLLLIAIVTTMTMTLAGFAAEPESEHAHVLQHVVCFKFKDDAAKKDIDHLVTEFAGLKKKISQIHAFEWGTNVSPEQHDKGFTHCFIATFKTAKARDEYLVHKHHKEFVKLVGPIVADVFVIDFWARH